LGAWPLPRRCSAVRAIRHPPPLAVASDENRWIESVGGTRSYLAD
jgi:hypothetical protein